MAKERIDKLLVERGFAESRTKAQAMVMAGLVLVGDRRIEKPSEMIAAGGVIRLKGASEEMNYVSRGGLKLEAALTAFSIDPTGWTCIDIGSSTGGFTDCLLQHGAASVTAIDAGTNQMDWRLRSDRRVEVRENTNARYLTPADFDVRFDLAVMDVSFISVRNVIPAVAPLLTEEGRMIVLVKPQFEVGKGEVGKGGVVRDEEKREGVMRSISTFVEKLGLKCRGVIDSPITGAKGNREMLAFFTTEGGGVIKADAPRCR